MQAINPHGRKVGILNSQWPALQEQGFTLPEYYKEFPASEESAQWIFISRPLGGLGDAICIEPVIRGLHAKWPEVKVALDTPKKYWSLFTGVDTFYDVTIGEANLPAAWNLKAHIDLDCPCDQYESSTGYRPEKDRTTIFCETAKVEPSKPKLWPTPEGLKFASAWLEHHNIDLTMAVGLQAMSAEPAKDWIKFQGLAQVLAEKGLHVIVFSEIPRPQFETRPNIHVAHSINIETFIALCFSMQLIITPDSAAFHIGGALGVPTLGLFGLTKGALAKRWYPSAQVIQSAPFPECPCHFYGPNKNEACLGGSSHCMLQLTVHEVFKKAEDMLCL